MAKPQPGLLGTMLAPRIAFAIPRMKGHVPQRNFIRLALGGCCFRPVFEPAYASGRKHMSVTIYGRVCSCRQRFIRWLSPPT